MSADRGRLLAGYESMLLTRGLENALIEALATGERVYIGHPVRGQEAVAAGVCAALNKADRLYCGHRAKHWAISKGCDLSRLAAEFCGKVSGLSGGWGGEMHMRDTSVGFMGSNHVVGSSLPLAVGSALASKLRGDQNVTVVAFGDGASVQGTFHEALNLAAIWDLPVLFVCENNHYAESTSVDYFSRPSNIYQKALPYGIDARQVDGQDMVEVMSATLEMVDQMRVDSRPRMIEAKTYRYLGHYYGDVTTRYRTKHEETAWTARDPIELLEATAAAAGILTSDDIEAKKEGTSRTVADAVRHGIQSPAPSQETLELSAYSHPGMNNV